MVCDGLSNYMDRERQTNPSSDNNFTFVLLAM